MDFRSNQKFCELSVLALSTLKGILSIDDDEFFKIEISLREAVNNAIVHGNGLDPDKRVHIDYSWDRTRLRIRVCDQHVQTTDFRQIEESINRNDVLAFSGRGITIMRSYMDLLEFHRARDGNEVVMEKKLR